MDSGLLVPGTLDMLILQSVRQGEPMHGYAIVTSIQQRSAEVLKVDEGALYPALHRLEVRGLLRSKWGFSNNNRRAKYYSLTDAGRQELDREAAAWRRISAAIARVMKPFRAGL
jgi:PadR family transcriptional regulator